jgi:hypothetical protein
VPKTKEPNHNTMHQLRLLVSDAVEVVNKHKPKSSIQKEQVANILEYRRKAMAYAFGWPLDTIPYSAIRK